MIWLLLAALALWQAARWLRLGSFTHAPTAPPPKTSSSLSRRCAVMAAAHPGDSGVQMLEDGPESLAVRVALLREATQQIDLQYYIWREDAAGLLLFKELAAAAARGVRVRLLLDDFGTQRIDEELSALAAQPGISIRLFNPSRLRWPRFPNYLADFPRLNRRMHNKLLLVDNAAAVLGGRNIGDEYFHAAHKQLQADLDLLATGPIIAAIAEDFEAYWACPSAWPLEKIVRPRAHTPTIPKPDLIYQEDLPPGSIKALFDAEDDFQWGEVQLFSDNPAKGMGAVPDSGMMGWQLLRALSPIQRSLVLVSAYFVPLPRGVAALSRLAAAGVTVDIVTNSLKTNNVIPVHAGYAASRVPLLRAGVHIWEMRPPLEGAPLLPRRRRWWQGGRLLQSHASGLHGKALVADSTHLFIGSMNFDPRSWWLNTEMGLLITHPELAAKLETTLRTQILDRAWRLSQQAGRLAWDGNGADVSHKEPETSAGRRLAAGLLALLPIKQML